MIATQTPVFMESAWMVLIHLTVSAIRITGESTATKRSSKKKVSSLLMIHCALENQMALFLVSSSIIPFLSTLLGQVKYVKMTYHFPFYFLFPCKCYPKFLVNIDNIM